MLMRSWRDFHSGSERHLSRRYSRAKSLSGDGDTRNSHFSWHITRSVGAGLSQSLDHTTVDVRNWYRTVVRDYSSGLCSVEALIHA